MIFKKFNLRGVVVYAFIPVEEEIEFVTIVSGNKSVFCSLQDWDFSNINEVRLALSIMYREKIRYDNAQFVHPNPRVNIFGRRKNKKLLERRGR